MPAGRMTLCSALSVARENAKVPVPGWNQPEVTTPSTVTPAVFRDDAALRLNLLLLVCKMMYQSLPRKL